MSDLPTLRQRDDEEPAVKRRRFSADTINDLLFWSMHLCLVTISLGIVWYKIDKTNEALKKLLDAQAQELVLVKRQVVVVEEQTALVRAQEQQRVDQLKANQNALGLMLTSMTQIQTDIRKNLAETQGINETVLEVANQAKQASLQAANAAGSAATAASNAASAASTAAARSSATKTLVREKVVTTEDKIRIQQEQQALAAKKAQLSKTIKQVKKNGPNLLQQIFH